MRYDGEELTVSEQPYGWVVIKGTHPDDGILSCYSAGHFVSLVFSSKESAEDFARAMKRCRGHALRLNHLAHRRSNND